MKQQKNSNSEVEAGESREETLPGADDNDASREIGQEAEKKTTIKQKLAAGLLAIFAVVAIFLWAGQLRNSLPGDKPLAHNPAGQTTISSPYSREVDTDGDGISDYDEVYYYKTSPYLEDTDGDGLSDKMEIEMGEDPNCPRGQNCFNPETGFGEESMDYLGGLSQEQQEQLYQLEQLIEASKGSTSVGVNLTEDEAVIKSVLGGQTDSASLRALLKEFGMSKELLGQISDDDLMKIYEETLGQ